jgi:hypothetical protein
LFGRPDGIVTYFLDEIVGVSMRILPAVNRHAPIIQLERQLERVRRKGTVLETSGLQMLREISQDYDVFLNLCRRVIGANGDTIERFAVENTLRVTVGQLGSGSDSIYEIESTSIQQPKRT